MTCAHRWKLAARELLPMDRVSQTWKCEACGNEMRENLVDHRKLNPHHDEAKCVTCIRNKELPWAT